MSDELISLINADVESEYLSAGAVIRRAVWSYYKQLRNAKLGTPAPIDYPVTQRRPVLSPSMETLVQKLDETGAGRAGRNFGAY